jgi:hypothetical protein
MTKTDCICTVAGYCRRHGAIKSQRLVDLCQNDLDTFLAFDVAAAKLGLIPKPPEVTAEDLRKEQGRKSWSILHAMETITEESLASWLNTVPSFGCPCRDLAIRYIENNQPPYGGSRRECFDWAWKFHNDVDVKTGDTPMPMEEAEKFWGVAPMIAPDIATTDDP